MANNKTKPPKSRAVGRGALPRGLTNTHSLPDTEVTCTPEGAAPLRTAKNQQTFDEFQLTPKERRFCDEYLTDMRARDAALRTGYAQSSATVQADRMLKNPYCAAYIRMRQAQTSERTGITVDKLVADLVEMANVDVNELVEFRRGACRYCYGANHQYQYTQNEWLRLTREHEAKQRDSNVVPLKTKRKPPAIDGPDPLGGIGFNPNLPAHPACPECHGDGAGRAVFKDSAKASPAARRLYQGVKETQHGIETKLLSQLDIRKMIGDHLGAWAPQKVEMHHSGAITQKHEGEVTLSPSEAYQAMLRGGA